MNLSFSKEELAFRDEVRAWIKEALPEDLAQKVGRRRALRGRRDHALASDPLRKGLGGIGISHEHDIGLFFKRMHVLNTLFGDEAHHAERYAASPAFSAVIA